MNERKLVLAKCGALERSLGLPTSSIEVATQSAKTQADLSGLLKFCESELTAYPPRPLDREAADRGRRLYTTLGCMVCHGQDGRGGEGGPSLLRSQRVMRDKKGEAIGEVVRNGVPNTAMPPFHLTSEQLSDVAEFLHSIQVEHLTASRIGTTAVTTGDAQAGKRYFDAKCGDCHSSSGDLKGIGIKYLDLKVLQ